MRPEVRVGVSPWTVRSVLLVLVMSACVTRQPGVPPPEAVRPTPPASYLAAKRGSLRTPYTRTIAPRSTAAAGSPKTRRSSLLPAATCEAGTTCSHSILLARMPSFRGKRLEWLLPGLHRRMGRHRTGAKTSSACGSCAASRCVSATIQTG